MFLCPPIFQAPFKAGIWRRGFLEVLERRVLKDMPKLAAKGTATVLFQIKNKRTVIGFSPYNYCTRSCWEALYSSDRLKSHLDDTVSLVSGVYMLDPHDVTHVPEKGFYRDRLNEIVWIISKLTLKGRIADTEFLVSSFHPQAHHHQLY